MKSLLRHLLLIYLLPVFCFAQSEQEILDKGGPEALLVINKAYEQLAETGIFECRDAGWGTPSASCWGLTVLVRYGPKDEVADFFLRLLESKNTALRLYGAIGLQLLYPKHPEASKLLQDETLLSSKVYFSSGCLGLSGTGSDLLEWINKEEGGIEGLLFKAPIPRLYQTRRPPNSPTTEQAE